MSKLIKVPTVKSGDNEAVACEFIQRFNDAQNAMPRVLAFGIFAHHTKLNELKHGQFLPWLRTICPPERSSDSFIRCVQSHLNLTESVLAEAGIQIRNAFRICDGGKILLLPEASVTEAQKPIRKKILDIVEGKSSRQLFAEFKQSELEESPKPKRGRLKGQGGASKEQRAAAAEREEQARIEAVELDVQDTIALIDKHCDAKGYGAIKDGLLKKLNDALFMGSKFTASLIEARKGK